MATKQQQLTPECLRSFSALVGMLANYSQEDRAAILDHARDVLLAEPQPPVEKQYTIALKQEKDIPASLVKYAVEAYKRARSCTEEDAIDAVKHGIIRGVAASTTYFTVKQICREINANWWEMTRGAAPDLVLASVKEI